VSADAAEPRKENVVNALHLHLRRYGALEIARRHPRLFHRLVVIELN
jgi:hypothetical protein